MTVEELIEQLRCYNQEAEVMISCNKGEMEMSVITEIVGWFDYRDKIDPHQIVRIIGY